MNKIYLFQPQYSLEYKNTDAYWIPYSAGCLWSYATQFDDITSTFELSDIIYKREDPAIVLSKITEPVLCGFSCYAWNEKYCLHLAKIIKQKWPKCVILFGGPNTNGSYLKHNFIDSLVLSEGEETFVEILRCIAAGGIPETVYKKTRLDSLDIPSPYASGVFDKLINDNPDNVWSTVLETNRGCPYACTFCDWGSMTYSKIKKFELSKVQADLNWMVDKPIKYLFCGDANFGIFKKRDLEIAKLLKETADQLNPDVINIQYAKNSTEAVFEISKILGKFSKGITVSVQSMNKDTLVAIKRSNMDINDIQHMMALSKQYDLPTYSELILGLPEETLESWKDGLSELLELGQQTIDIWFANLLVNSELATEETRRKYQLKTIQAEDYFNHSKNDWSGIIEEVEIITGTNTMSFDDIINGYMYGWMIVQFHCTGYSHLIANYLRHNKSIPYRVFYDKVFEMLHENNELSEHFVSFKESLRDFLTTGKIAKHNNFKEGHAFHKASYEYLYKNKNKIYDLAIVAAKSFTEIDVSVIELQKHSVYDQNESYPININSNINIDNWTSDKVNYTIEAKIEKDKEFNFYYSRRQGYIRNRVLKS